MLIFFSFSPSACPQFLFFLPPFARSFIALLASLCPSIHGAPCLPLHRPFIALLASLCLSIHGAAIERMCTSHRLCAIIRQCTITLSLYNMALSVFCFVLRPQLCTFCPLAFARLPLLELQVSFFSCSEGAIASLL